MQVKKALQKIWGVVVIVAGCIMAAAGALA
jgi:hypothetical protein